MTTHPNAILRLFWRQTRQAYVPLTRAEIHARLKADPDEVNTILRGMARDGLLRSASSSKATHMDLIIYDATDRGRAAHRAAIMAEGGA